MDLGHEAKSLNRKGRMLIFCFFNMIWKLIKIGNSVMDAAHEAKTLNLKGRIYIFFVFQHDLEINQNRKFGFWIVRNLPLFHG